MNDSDYNLFGIFSIIIHSIIAPTKSIPETNATSISRYNKDFFVNFFFSISKNKIQPREIASPYETNSKIPNGVKKITKGLEYVTSDKFIIELNTKPVENAEIVPITRPMTGINITNAIFRLFKNIPNSSMSLYLINKVF